MGKRASILDEFGPAAFSFLVDSYGFTGPDQETPAVGVGSTLVYRRPGLSVSVQSWVWRNETGFDTTLTDTSAGERRSASLDRVFESCGLGTARDVPRGNSGGGYTTRRRIHQHAEALRAVMPLMDGPNASRVLRSAV